MVQLPVINEIHNKMTWCLQIWFPDLQKPLFNTFLSTGIFTEYMLLYYCKHDICGLKYKVIHLITRSSGKNSECLEQSISLIKLRNSLADNNITFSSADHKGRNFKDQECWYKVGFMGSCDTVWQKGGGGSCCRNFKQVPITQVSTASYDKTFNQHNESSNYFSFLLTLKLSCIQQNPSTTVKIASLMSHINQHTKH